MSLLRISAAVRKAFGEKNAASLDAGIGLPADAQCWIGGETINFAVARPGSVALSAVVIEHPGGGGVALTLFSCTAHEPVSAVIDEDEMHRRATKIPSQVVPEDAMLVEGDRVI